MVQIFKSGGGGITATEIHYVYDGVSVVAVDGNNRLLKDRVGNTVLDFKNRTSSIFDGGSIILRTSAGVAAVTLSTTGNLIISGGNVQGNTFQLASGNASLTSSQLQCLSAYEIKWFDSSYDIGIKRLAAGVVGITDGASGKGSIDINNLTFAGSITLGSNVFGPPAATTPGVPVNAYGGSTGNYLGEADYWLLVRFAGNNYKIPMYLA